MSTAIGIDLGTTFSAISHVNKHGVAEILPNELGKNITPSVLFFEGDQITVGEEAERGAVAYPEQVVQFVKREIGEEKRAQKERKRKRQQERRRKKEEKRKESRKQRGWLASST